MRLNPEILNSNLIQVAKSHGGRLIPLVFDLPKDHGVAVMNPSICNHNGEYYVNFRCINYNLWVSQLGKYPNWNGTVGWASKKGNDVLKSENYLAKLDGHLNICEVKHVDMMPEPKDVRFQGLEDGRLISWNGDLYVSGTRFEYSNGDWNGGIYLSHIQDYKEVSRSRISDGTQLEKNWMPFAQIPGRFVRWINPYIVVDINLMNNNLSTVIQDNTHTNYSLRGGTQFIKYDDHYIGIAHSVSHYSNEPQKVRYEYFANLVILNHDLSIKYISPRFKFTDNLVEFHSGIAYDYYTNEFIISFSTNDSASYLVTIDTNALLKY